jgi:hypothetical protein
MSADLHILYAVLRVTDSATARVRLSEPLPWAQAIDAHTALHARRERGEWVYNRPTVDPGYRIGSFPVAYFAVRSAIDPDWPAVDFNWRGRLAAV